MDAQHEIPGKTAIPSDSARSVTWSAVSLETLASVAKGSRTSRREEVTGQGQQQRRTRRAVHYSARKQDANGQGVGLCRNKRATA